MKKTSLLITTAAAITLQMTSAYAVTGKVTEYNSPVTSGVVEKCIALDKIPGGIYYKDDVEKEHSLCSIDFYDPNVALCPKEKSTSPGTYVFGLNGTSLEGKQSDAEEYCSKGIPGNPKKLASYKQSMNQSGTSATNSWASLLYYHLSRYFETNLYVPVSVFRTMDIHSHYERVTSHAHGKGSMNIQAWKYTAAGESDPAHDPEQFRRYTDGLRQIFGVLLRAKGERYGTYFYGTRESGWAKQYLDFENAIPYASAKSEKPLIGAIQDGILSAKQISKIQAELHGHQPSMVQSFNWMMDISEIAVLDYIFSQQDRVGNIDYIWYWVYYNNNGIQYKKVDDKYKDYSWRQMMDNSSAMTPEEIRPYKPQLIQRTVLGDNDAGGLKQYANYTKKFQMLEGIRHISPRLYMKVQELSTDLTTKGDLYNYMLKTFSMSEKNGDFIQFVENTKKAADMLKTSCKENKLQFDLNSESLNNILLNCGKDSLNPENCKGVNTPPPSC